jgi:hypothetical protein
MKSVLSILAALIVSNAAFAGGAVGALRSILKPGIYNGTNDAGDCSIIVNEVNFPRLAYNVTAKDSEGEFSKLVDDDSIFAFRPWKREFIQSDRIYIDSDQINYQEKILRTFGFAEGKLYVVVAESTSVDREFQVAKVECEISL